MCRGAYGMRLGQSFRLSDPPFISSLMVPGALLAATEVVVDDPHQQGTYPLPYEHGYLLCVQLKAQRRLRLWLNNIPALMPPLAAGESFFVDLRSNPIYHVVDPLHMMCFYFPAAALDDSCDGDMSSSPGVDVNIAPQAILPDGVVYGIAQAVHHLMGARTGGSQPLEDHLLLALRRHVISSYVGIRHQASRANALAPWQQRIAMQLIQDRIADGVPTAEIAEACGMSPGGLARAFKLSTGVSPHQWLLLRRIDYAQQLMENPQLSLADIATDAGFADQSHFTRTFTRTMGVSPGAWRRSLGVALLSKRDRAAVGPSRSDLVMG